MRIADQIAGWIAIILLAVCGPVGAAAGVWVIIRHQGVYDVIGGVLAIPTGLVCLWLALRICDDMRGPA